MSCDGCSSQHRLLTIGIFWQMCKSGEKSVPIKLSTKNVMHEIIINYLSMIHCLKLNWLTSVINGVLICLCTLTHSHTQSHIPPSNYQFNSLSIETTFQFLGKKWNSDRGRQLVPSCSRGVRACVDVVTEWSINCKSEEFPPRIARLAEYQRNIILVSD